MFIKSFYTRSTFASCHLVRRCLRVTAASSGTWGQNISLQERGPVQNLSSVCKLSGSGRDYTNQRVLQTHSQHHCSHKASLNEFSFSTHKQSNQCQYFSSHPTTDDKTVVPIFLRAQDFRERLAVISQHGRYKYGDILNYSAKIAQELSKLVKESRLRGDLSNPRVAFLCENDLSYVVAQWAVFMVGGIAVPLCKQHPTSEMQYFVEDSGASVIIGTTESVEKIRPIAIHLDVPMMILTVDDYVGEAEDHSEWLAGKVSVVGM